MNKHEYYEVRRMSPEKLRALCVKYDWYTAGDNEDYGKLLMSVKDKVIDTDMIIELATDIINHSEINYCFATEWVGSLLIGICDTFIKKK